MIFTYLLKKRTHFLTSEYYYNDFFSLVNKFIAIRLKKLLQKHPRNPHKTKFIAIFLKVTVIFDPAKPRRIRVWGKVLARAGAEARQ